jgi:lipid-binding SYLF domain-containing protein
MKYLCYLLISAFLLSLPVNSHALFNKKDPAEERMELQDARKEALAQLYEEKPSAQTEVENAVGYAVFSSLGVNVLLVSTENGGGILHDNRDGKDLYMKMFSAGGGIGMGVKNFSVIFIFHTAEALDNFKDTGWDFSGQADATAQADDTGVGAEGAATVIPGTTIYQLTKTGLALQATLQGTKFWMDEDLN